MVCLTGYFGVLDFLMALLPQGIQVSVQPLTTYIYMRSFVAPLYIIQIFSALYNNQINACARIGQSAMVYCAVLVYS